MNNLSPIFSTDEDNDTLGGRICRAREMMDLKTGEVANQLGVKKETIVAWERDRSEPRTNRLYMLAGILGVSPVWLMSGGGEGGPDQANAGPTNSTALSDAISEVRRLHNEAGKALEALEMEFKRRSS